MASWQLCLECPSAMLDAIGEAGVDLFAAEMEIRFARMPHGPTTNAVIKIEQAGLVRNLRTGLGRYQAARRRRWNRRLLVTGSLAQKATGTNRNNPRLRRSGLSAGHRLAWNWRRRCWANGCRLNWTRRNCLRSARWLWLRRLGWLSFGYYGHFVRFYWRWPGLQAQTVRLADNCIATDAAKLIGNLAGSCASLPHLGQSFDAFVSPAHVISILFPWCPLVTTRSTR